MAKQQTRKSLSFSKILHDRIAYEAQQDGLTKSHWVEQLVRSELERRGRPLRVITTHVTIEHARKALVTRAANRAGRAPQ